LASIYIKIEEIKHLVLQELQLNLFSVSTVNESINEDEEDKNIAEINNNHLINQQILEEENEEDEDEEKTVFNKSENTFTTMNNNSSYYNE